MEQLRRAAVRAGLMGMNGTSVAMHKLEAFASILLDEENEACAKVCDDIDKSHWGCEVKASWCSDAIRERRKA